MKLSRSLSVYVFASLFSVAAVAAEPIEPTGPIDPTDPSVSFEQTGPAVLLEEQPPEPATTGPVVLPEHQHELPEHRPNYTPLPHPRPHMFPPEGPLPPEPKLTSGYKDGFFVGTPDGNSQLRINGLLQPRLTVDIPDNNPNNITATMAVQRAQLELSGYVLSKNISFNLKPEFGQSFVFLKDAYLNYAFLPGAIELRAGQFKRPFSRQELSGDWKQGLVDRGLTNAEFGGGRDIGFVLHNNIEKSPAVEYSVGVFDGSADKPIFAGDVDLTGDGKQSLSNVKISNVPKLLNPTVVGRIGFNFGDVKGYNELDTDSSPMRFGVALSLFDQIDLSGNQEGIVRAEVDGIVKALGGDFSAAVYLGGDQYGNYNWEQDLNTIGTHLQAGYMIMDVVHPAIRYDFVGTDVGSEHEITGGITVLLMGQNAQLQIDGSLLLDQVGSPVILESITPSGRVRTQLTLAF